MESRAEEKGRFTAKDFERVNHHFDLTGSVHETPKKRRKMKRTRENAEKTEGDVERQATVFSKEHCASVDTKSYYNLEVSVLRH